MYLSLGDLIIDLSVGPGDATSSFTLASSVALAVAPLCTTISDPMQGNGAIVCMASAVSLLCGSPPPPVDDPVLWDDSTRHVVLYYCAVVLAFGSLVDTVLNCESSRCE